MLQKSLEIFPCKKLLGDWHVLSFQPDVDCGTTEHQALQGLSWMFIILWAVMLPLALFLYLAHLYAENKLHTLQNRSRFGYLILRYGDRFWFWSVLSLS